MPVIDASVYVALVNAQEPAHATSLAWYHRMIEERAAITAPNIILAEVAAALSRGLGDAALALQAVEQLQRSKIITLAPISHPLAELAADVAARYCIRGCDALYVALARQTGDDLVTLDQQQLARGGAVVHTHAPL
jgi:predicted nucleic acid-binding protein